LNDARRYDEAIERAKRLLELEPNFTLAHEELADVYLRLKKYEEALAETQIVVNLDPDEFYKTFLIFLQMKVGQKSMTEVKAAIDHLVELSKNQHVSPRMLAWFHTLVHDEEPMFNCLKRAFDEHDMQLANFRFNPDFEPYWNDLRFTSLIQKMGLDLLSPVVTRS
jgi:tetratricopeptide (TPR) repeat protein